MQLLCYRSNVFELPISKVIYIPLIKYTFTLINSVLLIATVTIFNRV